MSASTTLLNGIDCGACVANLLIAYFFDHTIDENKLRESIDKLVSHLPLLSSVIASFPTNIGPALWGERKYYLQHVKPSNVKLYVKEIEPEMFDLFNLTKEGPIDYQEGGKLSALMENCEVTMQREAPKEGVPVMKVTLLKTKGEENQKCILGVSVNHAVVDGHSYVDMMKVWADCFNDKAVSTVFCHERYRFATRSRDFMTNYPSKEEKIKLGIYYPLDFSDFAIFAKKHLVRNLHFSEAKIAELKKEVKTDKKFSTNDVICAHLWRLYAALRKETPDDKIMPINVVLDVRKRTTIPENYFGNATQNLICEKTRKEILSMDWTELVMTVRKLVDSYNENDLQHVINENERGMPPVSFNWTYGTTIDDWRFISSNLPKFGEANCVRLCYCPPGGAVAPNFFIIYKVEDGVTVTCPLAEETFNKTLDIDLATSEAFEKVKNL